MSRIRALAIAALLLGQPALAGPPVPAPTASLPAIEASRDDGLVALQTSDEIRPFAAVGRLDTGNGFCTATLVAHDLLLTAAHCLYDSRTGARRPDTDYVFHAGLRNGQSSATRRVRQSFVFPGYAFGDPDTPDRVSSDLALLRLDRPITDGGVQPLPVQDRVRRGDEVQVVSYGAARQDYASLQESCEVLARDPGIHVLDCAVEHGSSGAPVLRRTGSGYAVVAVVSSMAVWDDGDVAISAELDGQWDALVSLTRVAEPRITVSAGLPTVRTLGSGADGRSSSGALFIRP